MPAWSSPALGAGLWWLASQPAGLVLNLSILAGSQISSSEIRTERSCSKWHGLFAVPHWQPARLHYTGSLFQLPSSLYHLRVWKKRWSKCSCLENYFPELDCLSESFTKKSKKQPSSTQLCWHGIHQSELDLTSAEGAFALKSKSEIPQNVQGTLEDRLLTVPQELGPPLKSVQAILTTSASIFLKPGNISGWRGLLQANSSYTFRKQRQRVSLAGEALDYQCRFQNSLYALYKQIGCIYP